MLLVVKSFMLMTTLLLGLFLRLKRRGWLVIPICSSTCGVVNSGPAPRLGIRAGGDSVVRDGDHKRCNSRAGS